MAKYSTGGIGGDSGGACELCGKETTDLRTETVAGAKLSVCRDCAQHGEGGKRGGSGGSGGGGQSQPHNEERERRKRAARNVARLEDSGKGDSKRWEEGADYEDDPLPYLVRGYADRLEEARQDAGLTPDELADELGASEDDILAIEQGRATQAGIGGSLIEAIEERLGVELAE